MSITPLEAMARGLSVVAHNREGMAEALTPAKRTSGEAIVAFGDTAAFADDAVAAQLPDRDLAAREGRAGRQLAEENHDLRSWARRLSRITETVAAGDSRSG